MSNNVATHSVQVAWTGQLTGIFTIGRSPIGGADVLAGGFGANVFDDITSDVKAAHYERGRAGDGGNMQQGAYQVRLKDSTGTYNPENPDSPLAPYLVPMRPIRHTADGPMVGGTALTPTFARASVAYLSDGSLVTTGLPRFETVGGRQGLMVEEGATNLVTNPSFEVDLSGWGNYGGYSASGIRDTTQSTPLGLACLKIVRQAASGYEGKLYSVNVTAGSTYTISLYVRVGIGTPTARCTFSGAATGSIALSVSTDWPRFSGTFVAASTGTVTVQIFSASGAIGDCFYVDGVQLEAKPYPTAFTDTTRAAETATIPTAGVLSAAEGTVEMWVNVTAEMLAAAAAPSWPILFASAATGNIAIFIHPTLVLMVGLGAITVSTSVAITIGWHQVAVKWAGLTLSLYVDGVLIGSTALSVPPAIGPIASIGSAVDGWGHCDGLISDFRISSRARTDAEIAAAYAVGTLPVDVDTTYKLPLDGTLVPQTWGNQGLFYGFISEISHDPDARESTISAVDLYEWLTMAKPIIAAMTGARVDTIIAAILDAVEWTDPGMRLLDASLDTVPSWSADGTKTALALIGELLATDLGAFFIDGSGLARYVNRRIRYGGATLADTLTGSHISRIKASVSKDDITNSQTVTRTGGTPQTATDAASKRAYGSRVGSDITSDYLASDSHANSLAGFLVALKKAPRVPARSVGIINGDSVRLAKLLAREIGDLVAVTEARGGTDMVGRVQSLSVDISEGFTVQQGRYTVDKATLTPFVVGESVIGSGQIAY